MTDYELLKAELDAANKLILKQALTIVDLNRIKCEAIALCKSRNKQTRHASHNVSQLIADMEKLK